MSERFKLTMSATVGKFRLALNLVGLPEAENSIVFMPPWYCGYVGVPPGHVLWGIPYGEPRKILQHYAEYRSLGEIGKLASAPILLFCMASEGGVQPELDYLVEVHGGITYSASSDGTYPLKMEGGDDYWYFGFDCNHSGDNPDVWPREKAWDETMALAKELHNIARFISRPVFVQRLHILARRAHRLYVALRARICNKLKGLCDEHPD